LKFWWSFGIPNISSLPVDLYMRSYVYWRPISLLPTQKHDVRHVWRRFSVKCAFHQWLPKRSLILFGKVISSSCGPVLRIVILLGQLPDCPDLIFLLSRLLTLRKLVLLPLWDLLIHLLLDFPLFLLIQLLLLIIRLDNTSHRLIIVINLVESWLFSSHWCFPFVEILLGYLIVGPVLGRLLQTFNSILKNFPFFVKFVHFEVRVFSSGVFHKLESVSQILVFLSHLVKISIKSVNCFRIILDCFSEWNVRLENFFHHIHCMNYSFCDGVFFHWS